MLTDELFGEVKEGSLTDQLFVDKPKDLTEQLTGQGEVQPTEVKMEIPEADLPMFQSKLKELTDQGKSGLEAMTEARDFYNKTKAGVRKIAEELRGEAAKQVVEPVKSGITNDTIQGRLMREMLTPSVEEFDKLKTNPIISDEFKQGVMSTLKGYGQLATQPLEIVRGGAEFVLSLPGFALGVLGASQRMVERMGRRFTFNDLYSAAASGMQDMQKFWGEKMVEPLLGAPTEASSLVGQTAMAPALGLSLLGQHIAGYFEGYPNVQGLSKFAGDISGLVALGRVYKGDNSVVTAKAESIVRRAEDIAKVEDQISQNPDAAVKSAQQKILDMRKNQLEMEAAELQKDLDYGKMIKDDLTAKGRRVAQIKQPKKYIADEAINKVMEGIKEKKVKEPMETISGKTEMLISDLKEEAKKVKEEPIAETVSREKAEANLGKEIVLSIEEELGKPIEQTTKTELKDLLDKWEKEDASEVDAQTGVREPEELGTHQSPFRERDPQVTAEQRRLLAEKRISDSPEMMIAKWTNDVNSWLDKNEEVDIAKARNSLSDFAVAVNDPANQLQLLDYFDGDSGAVRNFAETASEAAKWARRAEREPSSVTPGMGVDIAKAYKIAIDTLKGLRNVAFKTGKVRQYGQGPFHGADIVDLESILKNGLRPGSAIDTTRDWIGDYPVVVTVPSAKKGKFIEHNKYYTTPEKADVTRVSIDLEQYEHLEGNKIIDQVSKLAKEYPNVKFDIVNEPGAYKAKYSVEDLTKMYDEISELYKYRDPRIAELRAEVDRIKEPFKDPRGFYKNISREVSDRLTAIDETVKRLERQHNAKIRAFEGKIRNAEKDVEYIEPSVDLNMMIPLDKVPGAVKDVLKATKVLAKDIFRNEKIWRKTGFWFAQDGKWRYEIDEGRLEVKPKVKEDAYNKAGLWEERLSDVIDYPELLKAVPKAEKIWIRRDKSYAPDEGGYDPISGTVTVGSLDEKTLIHELQHAVNSIAGSKFKGSNIAGKSYFEYVKSPGEIEARLAEARMNMSAAERARIPPWETLDTMLGYEKWTTDMRIGKKHGMKLYDIGGATAEGAKQIVEMAKKAKDYVVHARGMKAFKPKLAAQLLKEEFKRAFIDRSGSIRSQLLEELGEDGYSVVQKMYLSKGASSISANMLKQMRKEVYDGLSGNEKRILDTLILADRMIDIGSYKTPKQFKFPKGLSPEESIAYKELFQQVEKISSKEAENLRRKAESYFEWMKRPLQSMLDAGLITQEEFTALVSHNYRRIKLVDIYDKRYQAKIGKRTRTVYDSGVEALAKGRDTDVFEPSSEVMALEVFNRAYGRVMNNEANKSLLEVARKHPDNPFVRVSEKEGGQGKIPSGWNRIFAYEEGVRKSAYLSPEMSREWITNNPEMSYRLSQFLRLSSGSPILRTFATGINWSFALANLPRDVMHTWFAARTFEDGKWKPIYNSNAPVFAVQMGRDLATVFTDAVLRKGRYEDYINEGGGMEFLVHQGRILQRGRHLEGPIDKIQNFMGYFGETSEILTRLAIRERVLRKGKSAQEATFAARDYMDFGQGGGIAKAADNGIPYLNAAIQGTRGLFRAFKDNPVASTYKLSQFAALVSGIYIAMDSRAPETKKNLKNSLDMTNNLVLPLGDEFGFLDNQGQMRYPYLKIPLDPGQKFFKKFFEASTDKWLGNEVDVSGTAAALKELSPVPGVSGILPPTVSGALGYVTNKDFWLNEDIWKQSEPFSYPGSKEEYTSKTPQAYVDFGKATGLSPERTRHAVEELVTSGTEWSYLLGKGYEAAFGDMPKEKKEQHLAMVLSKMPIAKRFIGVTNPYSKHAEKMDKAQEETVLKDFVENRNFDIKVEGYLYGEKGQVSREEVIKDAQQYKNKDTYDRLIDRFKFEEAIKDLPEKSFWRRMKGLRLEAKAKVFADRLKTSNEGEKEQLWKEYGIVSRAKGVISPEFRSEVMKQMSEKVD